METRYSYLRSYLLLTIIICWFPGNAFSQSDVQQNKGFHPGLTVETGIPLAEFGKNYDAGLGATAFVAWRFPVKTQLIFSAGYMHFPGISSEDKYFIYNIPDWEVIPVRFGAQYYATPHFFLEAESGGVFFLEPGKGTSFILSPGIGLQIHHFQATAKLETWTDGGTVSFAGFSLGYFF